MVIIKLKPITIKRCLDSFQQFTIECSILEDGASWKLSRTLTNK